jgi:hypothetical protein
VTNRFISDDGERDNLFVVDMNGSCESFEAVIEISVFVVVRGNNLEAFVRGVAFSSTDRMVITAGYVTREQGLTRKPA